jgi:23S rRNA pseudouridine1911/1915/1917 synthase
MKKCLTVDARVPPPARNVIALVQSLLKIARKPASELLHEGMVVVNGRTVRQPHLVLSVGDQLEVEYAPQPVAPPKRKAAKREPFEIAYDDSHLMLVVKPAGMLTVPTPKREKSTLLSAVQRWLDREQPGQTACCVHRLDRGVSGLLVFAKSPEMAERLRNQFAQRKPERRYTAIVAGRVEPDAGTFRSFLATDADLNRFSTGTQEQGELAITHYEVREHLAGASLVTVRLETGRRNQIRVHFAEAGHPVLGDPRYQSQAAVHRAWPHKRLALHAESLGIQHPVTGERLQYVAPWPQEFRDFRRKTLR